MLKTSFFTNNFVLIPKLVDFMKGMVINMEKKKISLKEIGMPKIIGIGILGILLIILTFPDTFIPQSKDNSNKSDSYDTIPQIGSSETSDITKDYISTMEEKLEKVLRKVAGVGDVEVMITLKESKEQITLKDIPYTKENSNEADGEGGSRINSELRQEESTVLVATEDGKTVPYIIKEIEPEIEGIVVVAEGGDNITIITDIIEAAEVLFDVPLHKVKVMKMSDGIK